MAAVLYLLIQQGNGERFPVKATYRPEGQMLPVVQRQGWLLWDEALQQELRQQTRAPLRYGQCLGEAVFQDWLKELWHTVRGREQQPLRVLLTLDDPTLHQIYWERLAAPGPLAGQWTPLALDQMVQFVHYLPRQVETSFPPLAPRDLRALLVVANPPPHNRFQLQPFAAATLATLLQQALDPISSDHLSSEVGAVGMPTLDALCGHLATTHYPILHLVAHGQYRSGVNQTYLYLLDEQGEVAPVPLPDFIRRLGQLNRLPHFIFLSVCESAHQNTDSNATGIAQQLVQVLGIPAVIAMRETITQTTANALSASFYHSLRRHGNISQALNEAAVSLADAPDITMPALYTCLEQTSLFAVNIARPLTGTDVAYGLTRLQRVLPERAPTCLSEWRRLETVLRPYLTAPVAHLSAAAQQEWQHALIQLDALCQEIFDLSFAAVALDYTLPDYDTRCPFPGLATFTGAESSFYFGREKLIPSLLLRLKTQSFLALVGASGCGKSSLALAGLLPAWQQETPNLKIAVFTPGATPYVTLQTQLATMDNQGPTLLVVDQFEELFTLCQDESERGRFLDLLLAQPPHGAILLTMRADFWGECAPYPALRQQMQVHQELIAPLTIAELQDVIKQQAAATGLRLENGLIEQLVQDVAGEPGAMPLLQHALRELWEQRRGRNLSLAAYQTIGGAQKAIAQTAEKVFLRATLTEQAQIRNLFLRLIRLDPEANPGVEPRDTRQHIPLPELVPVGNTITGIHDLVTRLASARLLVTDYDAAADQEQVQIIHEALIRYWPRLQSWLAEDRTLLQLRQGIRQAAREWQAAPPEQQASLLLHRGVRLIESLLAAAVRDRSPVTAAVTSGTTRSPPGLGAGFGRYHRYPRAGGHLALS
jgi:energy-coupling factor transporter ATP-binding protein EcfA2